ncbi:MAG: DUF2007 domain-containing protein [Sphingobacteriaceae bacterium]|nr:DUF2007 domain-containing protein [Sphingobacteriaceae bacterium]
MENQNSGKLVEVFSGELWQVTMMQNILADNQIQSYLENSLMSTIEPWVVTAGGFKTVKLIVSDKDYAKSLNLIEEYNRSEPLEDTDE